jgi:hypothetical protein
MLTYMRSILHSGRITVTTLLLCLLAFVSLASSGPAAAQNQSAQELRWTFAGNTSGFGRNHLLSQPFWIGNFSRLNRADVLFYNPGDGNWFLALHSGNQLAWSYAGNTQGANPGDPNFGQIWDGRPFWIGDFNGDGRADVLFYYPGDGNWWLGSHNGNQLAWSYAGNTQGANPGDPNFGQVWDGRPFWIGNFSRSDRTEVLFYYPGDDKWSLGTHQGPGGQINWSFAGNTTGFGQGHASRQPVWIGNFSRPDRAEVLFYNPGDDNWWLGSHEGASAQLRWIFAGNTTGFGQGHASRQLVRTGNFSSDRAEVLFYNPGDDNWFLGSGGVDLRVEVDTINTATAGLPAVVQRGGQNFSLQDIFRSTGINIEVLVDQNVADPAQQQQPPQVTQFTNAALQNFMLANRNQQPPGPNVWWIQAQILTTHVQQGLLGIMFDQNGRRAIAVFANAIGNNTAPNATIAQAILQVAAHEVGHALNLFHSDADDLPCCQNQVGAIPQGRSIMNQIRCLGNNWGYFFSQAEQNHLLTHPANRLQPNSGIGFNQCLAGHTGTC